MNSYDCSIPFCDSELVMMICSHQQNHFQMIIWDLGEIFLHLFVMAIFEQYLRDCKASLHDCYSFIIINHLK